MRRVDHSLLRYLPKTVYTPGVIANLPEQPLPVLLLLDLLSGLHHLVHVLGHLPLLAGGQQGLEPSAEITQSGDKKESVSRCW